MYLMSTNQGILKISSPSAMVNFVYVVTNIQYPDKFYILYNIFEKAINLMCSYQNIVLHKWTEEIPAVYLCQPKNKIKCDQWRIEVNQLSIWCFVKRSFEAR